MLQLAKARGQWAGKLHKPGFMHSIKLPMDNAETSALYNGWSQKVPQNKMKF